jgi:hypothetical protein
MEERTKYILIGIIIGIAIGMMMLYLLMAFRIIRLFGFREFAPNDNFTNFTRPPRGV